MSGLTDTEQAAIRKIVLHIGDSDGLTLEQFCHFLKIYKQLDLTKGAEISGEDIDAVQEDADGFDEKRAQLLFYGMDVDNSTHIQASEIYEYIAATRNSDFKWMTKMIFRGADKDRSRKVSFDELQEAYNHMGVEPMTKEEFENKCKIELGSKKSEIEYWQFYKLLTGETLDETTDPYDGKLPEQKSKCCLLL